MKLVKMSLAAAVLLGASAFAIENVKVDGDAKVYYYTDTAAVGTSIFNQGTSAADTALRLGLTADLTKGVSFGATAYAVSTLGLENNLVANTWTGAHDTLAPGADGVHDRGWLGELWVAGTVGKTTAKVGRMSLDTPLAFSETWSVVPNTFDAAVILNQDIPDTTVVAAWVGKGNGFNVGQGGFGGLGYANASAIGIDGYMAAEAKFGTFADEGAYAAAIVNNSFKPLTAQAWYYNVANVADAYWLQADINCQMVKGLTIGAQYGDISPKGLLAGVQDSSAYAFKLGYNAVENLKLSAAYSTTDSEGVLSMSNVATNNTGGAQSKLYTEAYWNYGYVGAPDAKSWSAAAEYNAGVATVGAQYTDVSIDSAINSASVIGLANTDMKETALYVGKDFGPLNATVAYVNTDLSTAGVDNTNDAFIAMLKVSF